MPPVGGTFVKEVLDRSSKARVSSASTPGEPRQCNSSADAVPTFPLSSPSVNASTTPLAEDLQLKALSGLDLSSDAVGPAQQFDLAFSMATAIAGNEKDPEVQLKLLQDELASLQDFAPSHRQCKVEIAKLHRQNVQGTLHAAEQRNRRHMKLARDEMRRVQTHVGASSRVPAETRPPVPAPQTDAAAFVGDGRASVSFAQDVRAGCALPFCFNAYGTVGPNSLSSLSRTVNGCVSEPSFVPYRMCRWWVSDCRAMPMFLLERRQSLVGKMLLQLTIFPAFSQDGVFLVPLCRCLR